MNWIANKWGKNVWRIAGVALFAALLTGCANNDKKVAEEVAATEPEEVYDRDDAVVLTPKYAEHDEALAPQGKNTYWATNLIDGDPNTAWAVSLDRPDLKTAKQVYGPVFAVKCKKLSHVVINNGYGKSLDAYYNNARPAKVRVVAMVQGDYDIEDELLIESPLQDTPAVQRIDIPLDAPANNDILYIRLDFSTAAYGGVYAGKKWNDLCVSEVEFWGFK